MRRRLLDHRGIPKSKRKIFAQQNMGSYLGIPPGDFPEKAISITNNLL